jgi:hypothetical protein
MGRLEIVAVTALLVGGVPSPRHPGLADVLNEQNSADRLISSQSAITDPAVIAVRPANQLVGREVALIDVHVHRISPHGFWIVTSNAQDEVFVIPAEGPLIAARTGDRVSIHGEVRTMLADLRRLLFDGEAANGHVYIHAFTVRPTGLWEDWAPREQGPDHGVESSNRN